MLASCPGCGGRVPEAVGLDDGNCGPKHLGRDRGPRWHSREGVDHSVPRHDLVPAPCPRRCESPPMTGGISPLMGAWRWGVAFPNPIGRYREG